MSFERPAPDLSKIAAAWQEFENGDELPGKVLSTMKTAGFADVIAELQSSGWSPSAS